MGFYDCRCMITGLSLSREAVLVMLERTDGSYRPTALGIPGYYNRLGSIDVDEETANTDLLLEYFHARLRDGAFATEEPLDTIEELLAAFERNSLGSVFETTEPAATLNGTPIVTTLIAQPIWNALTAAPAAEQPSARESFEHVFGQSPTAHEIYQDRVAEFAEETRQLSLIDRFMADRGLTWAASSEPSQRYATDYGGQHYADDVRRYLEVARRDYADVRAFDTAFADEQTAIDEYCDD
ncbi:hypothetical protein [Pseudonocardia spinosispora]|uniref:hypothetical protein n=1 Tax=Pseudonocardia spinosispora TaxID=103441 RepID=UPI0004919ABC|nr:hypothetical protein [Pseudonocardia spinosispora]